MAAMVSVPEDPMRLLSTLFTMTFAGVLLGCAGEPDEGPRHPHALMTPTPPKPLPSAALVHRDGKPAASDLFQGHWTWLYVGYASCPDVCPVAMEFASREYRKLKAPERVRVVFLSVDPGRDRAPKLGQFVGFYHPDFVGVTADKPTIDALCQAVGASYVIDPPPKPGAAYTVSHSNLVFALDPQGRLAAVYAPGQTPGQLAEDFDRLTAKEKV